MKHLNTTLLLDYIEQTLDDAVRIRVEAHLNKPCQQCLTRLASLARLVNLMIDDRTYAPPAAVVEIAKRSFRKEVERQPRLSLIASLVFDSLRQPSLAAMRGIQTARQFLYSTEDYDIDIQVKNDESAFSVIGQILGDDIQTQSQAHVCLKKYDETISCLHSDMLGQFTFKRITPGEYQLIFQFEDVEISIQDLNLE